MKFTIAIETSAGLEERVGLLVDLSDQLLEFFSTKTYGEDLKEIIIRVISVAPEFEWFSKVRKPKFTAYRNYTSMHGVEIVEDRLFTFETKIDYERFKNQSDEQNKAMLAETIESSLSSFDFLPKKVKSFDKTRLISDLKSFFDKWCET